MKKIFIFILILMIVTSLYADFKIMGGLNISKYSDPGGDRNFKRSYKLGFLGGIGFERKLSRYILLEANILYFKKGTIAKFIDPHDSISKYTMNTVSLPFLVRAQLLSESSPYVVAGIELSYILSHNKRIEGQDIVDIKNETKDSDFGYVLGCGYQIELEEDLFFFIETRYQFGDRNMTRNLEEGTMKTNSVLLMIGLRS